MCYNWLWCFQISQSLILEIQMVWFLVMCFSMQYKFLILLTIFATVLRLMNDLLSSDFFLTQWYSHLECITQTALVMFWLTSWNQRFFHLNSSVLWRPFMIAIHKIKKNILPRKQKGKQEMIVEKSSEISSICLIKSPPLKIKFN